MKYISSSSMANTSNFFMSTILIMSLLSIISFGSTAAQVGVCYGQKGKNLPPPSKVVSLYKKYNITKMRLYVPHRPSLAALCGSGIELMLGVSDDDLPLIANCLDTAKSWVQGNITSYPNIKFRYITVGNEIEPDSKFAPFVLPAMQNLYEAVCEAGLGDQIRISTSVNTNLTNHTYPPADGVFKPSVTPYVKPIIEFLRDTNAPLLVSVYPYFAYKNDPVNINLSYALLQPDSGVCGPDGVYYDNLFYAMVDSVYAAMEKILAPSSSTSSPLSSSLADNLVPSVTVSETGVPTKSTSTKVLSEGDGEISTVENARIYNNNLMRIVKKGTPKRPGIPIETYIFAMFDEEDKTGDEDEKHFGIFRADGKPKYPLCFY